MLFSNNKIPYFGLDISDLSLKLVGIKKRKNSNEIINYNQAVVPPGYFADGKIIKYQEIAQLIIELIHGAQGPKIKTKFVHVSLPEKYAFVKLISLPNMTAAEVPTAVEWAVEHHLPFALDEIYLDWQIIDNYPDNKSLHVVIGAAPKDIVNDYTKLLKLAKLNTLSLEIEAVSIARAVINNKQPNPNTAIGIIDLGATRSSLIIYTHNSVQFSMSLPISGEKITQTISQTLNLSPQQAENAKIICGLDPKKCKGGIKTILENELDNLADKIKSGLLYYKQNFADSLPITTLILCGGGAHMSQLNEQLGLKTNLTVQTANVLDNIKIGHKLKLPTDSLLSATTAIGLALK
jgi:type IV pilus assembly protein PilM